MSKLVIKTKKLVVHAESVFVFKNLEWQATHTIAAITNSDFIALSEQQNGKEQWRLARKTRKAQRKASFLKLLSYGRKLTAGGEWWKNEIWLDSKGVEGYAEKIRRNLDSTEAEKTN